MVLRDRALERPVPVAVVAGDLELRPVQRQLADRAGAHSAGGQVVSGAALGLGPVHVIGMFVSHLRDQYQYTGMPASRMPSAIALFAGDARIALATIPAHASTKIAVV